MQVQHPHARRDTEPPGAATIDGTTYPVDSDGTVEAPATDAQALADAWAHRFDCDPDDLIVAETCDTVKSDGEVCGRDLPCPYHSED